MKVWGRGGCPAFRNICNLCNVARRFLCYMSGAPRALVVAARPAM
jgi:hypothetical protein